MSGCGCGQPVIISGGAGGGPAGPLRDVEPVLLCDVLADGTTAATVLVEPVYDATSGDRVGTRTVDPVTGADYTVQGTLQPCATATECSTCETLLLCDEGSPATIRGAAVSSGTLSNGVTWSTRGTNTGAPGTGGLANSNVDNADGAWWNTTYAFPNVATGAQVWTFNRPVHAEFSVYIRPADSSANGNKVLMSAGVEPVSLPTGYYFDPATNVLSADSTANTDCPNLSNPNKAASARFRTTTPVTSLMLDYLGDRIANCGRFGNWAFGAFDVTPAAQFLRHVCRDCTGAVTSVTNTLLDGTTAYTPVGTVHACQPPDEPAGTDVEPLLLCDTAPDGTVTQFLRHFVYAGPDGALDAVRDTALDGTTAYTLSAGGTVGQCQPVTCQFSPVCLRPSGRVEFISNPAGATSGTDADWVWGQSLTGPWYPMYQVGVFPGWTTTDPGTPEGQAHWVAPHPGAGVNNTGQPGEGPSITSAAPDWYARATFRLPDIADPATIRMAATVLNADQLAVEWRLNAGAWQPVNAAHNQPPYTLAPTAVPGAQAGVNEVFVHVRETVFPGGAAGVIMHLIATYDVAPSDYVQWTRVTCSDGTIYYLDDLGERQEALPDGWTIVPCPGGSGGTDGTDVETWPLCVLNTDGSVLQHVRAEQVYDASGAPTGPPRIVDAVTGGPVAIPGGATLGVCPDAAPSGRQIIERCGCDDADGDGVGEVRYIELWSVDPDGAEDPQLIGTYEDGDFTLPYTPVAPVDCPAGDGTTIACETVELCDSSPVPARLDAANTDPQHWAAILVPGAEANNPTGPSLQPLFDGGQVEIPPTPTQASNGSHHWSAGILSLADCACGEGTVTVTVSVDFTNDGPGDQIGGGSGLYLFLGDTQLAVDAVTAVAGASETATVTGSAPVADVLAGRLTLVVQAEGGQQGGNVKTWTLSNYQAEATTDCGRSFLRTVCRDAAGETVSTTDTLDGTTAYEPVGAVRICDKPVKTCGTGDPDGTAASGRQLIERCGCDDTNGDGVGDVRYIELWSVDPDGAGAPLLVGTYRDGDFEQPYTPVAPVDCPAGEAADGCAKQVIERCRCDDADGDGIGEVRYVELWAVDPCGGEEPVLLGTYQEDDLAAPYTPVAPVDCADEPSAPVTVLTGARSITGTTAQDLAGEFPTLQSVTLTVLAGSVLVTMSDGADVPVPAGATVTWSVVREEDGQLDTARFAGADAAASYLLVWTYRG